MHRWGKRAGDEGSLAHLIAEGGRARDRMEGKEPAARARRSLIARKADRGLCNALVCAQDIGGPYFVKNL